MDIEVARAYVPRLGRSVSVVVPVIETARPEGSGTGQRTARGDRHRPINRTTR
jgi:hypothetical protein